MNRRKLPPKEPTFHIARLVPDGAEADAWTIRAWVLPEHYNQDARRWQSWRDKECMIFARSDYAGLLRGMRAAEKAGTYTYRPEANNFVNSVLFVIEDAYRKDPDFKRVKSKRRPRADRKAVAA